ncbi:hypothetical protein [Nesterenkonia populi]
MSTTHYLTPDQLHDERSKLLGALKQMGISEQQLYSYAASWRLRPEERAIFQKISDYDWLIRMADEQDDDQQPMAA